MKSEAQAHNGLNSWVGSTMEETVSGAVFEAAVRFFAGLVRLDAFIAALDLDRPGHLAGRRASHLLFPGAGRERRKAL